MIKFIIFLIIFWIYSIVVFLLGRGYGNAENFDYIKNLKNENMMLKNDLSLKSVEDDEELQFHIDWLNRFNKICSEEY
jgi:hypothetical protein